MNVRQRKWKNKDGKVKVRWFADFMDAATGERVREHLPECGSELAAKKAAARLFSDREKNPKAYQKINELGSHTIALSELLESHRRRPGISDSTRKIELGQAANLIEKFGAGTPLSRITPGDLDDFVDARLKDPRGRFKKKDGTIVHSKRKVSGATVVKELKLLNQAIRWAQSRNMDVGEAFNKLPEIPVEKKRPRCLTRDEMRMLLEACGDDSSYMRQATEFCYLAGLRRAELFRLTWSNVDFPDKCIRFKTMKRGRSKTQRVDTVYLPKRAMDLLAARYKQLGNPDQESLVFGVVARVWNQIETTVDLNFSDQVESAAKRAGVAKPKEVGSHTLRHSCATHLLESGATVPEVASHLRHRDGGALLLRTYAHVFESGLRRAANLLAPDPAPDPPENDSEEILAQNGTSNIVDIAQAL